MEVYMLNGKADGELGCPWSLRRVWSGASHALNFASALFEG